MQNRLPVSDEVILWNARLLDSLPGGEGALLSDEFLRGTNLSIFHAERYHGPGMDDSWLKSTFNLPEFEPFQFAILVCRVLDDKRQREYRVLRGMVLQARDRRRPHIRRHPRGPVRRGGIIRLRHARRPRLQGTVNKNFTNLLPMALCFARTLHDV